MDCLSHGVRGLSPYDTNQDVNVDTGTRYGIWICLKGLKKAGRRAREKLSMWRVLPRWGPGQTLHGRRESVGTR